jgi:molybdopterin-binding protein
MNKKTIAVISNLTKVFVERIVLDIPSFSFFEGTTYALTGHNGSGKTTLLRILAGIDRPTTGSVEISEGTLVAFCPHKPYMFRGNVMKNLSWGLRNIDTAQLHNLARHLQLEQLLSCPAGNCSSGEMQKISLGRMLIRKPSLLLLDEPTANLDSQSRAIIENELISFTQSGGTCIIATHIIEQARRLSTDIIRLEQGKITHGEVTNIFEGEIDPDNDLSTIRINKRIPVIYNGKTEPGKKRFCIAASDIVLSLHPLESSMCNSFSGTVTALRQTSGSVEVTIDIGIPLQSLITCKSLDYLSLSIGTSVYASFKASAVKLL